MVPEQREALDAIIVKIRSGRLTRRSFLERALALGLSSSAAVSLLDACSGTSNSSRGNGQTTNIVWQSEQDSTPTYSNLATTFNNTIGKQKGIHVTWKQGPSGTDDLLTIYTNTLRARSSTLDVLSLDIIYPAQFATSKWIKPISESQWSASERQKYLSGPIKGCTYQGQIWAVPMRTDVGLLYYRTDIISTAPKTWDDLTRTAQSNQSKSKYGYVWQGAQYEGLVCNFIEVLHSYGGDVLDPHDPTKVIVNSPAAQQALTEMVSWVGTISPDAVTTYIEDPARNVWQSGNAIYMRNWPYAYKLSNDPSQSRIVGKFDIGALPAGGSNTTGHSAIGGWNLAINSHSNHPDEAWEFIQFMLQPSAQKSIAINASLTPTLQSVYDDPEVLQKQPLFGKLKPILQQAQPRPVSAKYTDVSDAIQRHVYQALKKQVSPSQALSSLQSELKGIVS